MKNTILIFICLIALLNLKAQNLDSLYHRVLNIRGAGSTINQTETINPVRPLKCGFGAINETKLRIDKFPLLQKQALMSVLQRPPTDTSIVSPAKRFNIHFNKTGLNAPLYNVNEFSKAADSSYNYEIKILGYSPPPLNQGSLYYDVYIQNLGGGDYGYTEFDRQITDSTYTCFTVIDNAFGNSYYTHGLSAARVTIAHEFHHAIQVGNYIFRPQDTYYYELTSTAMEEFVFSDVNDYYDYIPDYFNSPDRTFSDNDGYDLAVWHIFIKDRFGYAPIKRSWELMTRERALESISDAISEAGSSFKTEFNIFGQWTYFTGKRAVQNKYFKEAAGYPLISPMSISGSIRVNSEAVSNNFFEMKGNFSGTPDSVITLVSNSDIKGGVLSPASITPFNYTLAVSPISGGRQISNRFYSKLDIPNQSSLLSESNVLTGSISAVSNDYAYPQPFRYSRNQQLNLPVASNTSQSADLSVYTIDMRLVYSGQKRIVDSEKIIWDGLDNSGRKLSTGVYIFVINSDNQLKNGKLVIYND